MLKLYQKSEKIIFWVLVLLLVFIPLYPKLPLLGIPETFVAIRLEDVLIAVLFVLWSSANFKRYKELFKQTTFQAFLLFWSIGLLSIISGIFITYSVDAHLGLFHWMRRIEYMVLFLIVITSIKSLKQIKFLINISILVSLLVVLYGFGQLYLRFPVVSTTNSEFSKGLILYLTDGARVNSTFAGHYDLAIYLSILIILLFSLVFYYRKVGVKILLVLLGGLSFGLLALTAARISFVATILSVALVFLLNKKRLLVVVVFLVALGFVAAVPDLRHRLVATFTVNILGGGGPKYNPPPNTVTIFTPKQSLPEDVRVDLEKRLEEKTQEVNPDDQKIQVDTAPGEPVNSTELGVHRSFGIRLDVEWPRALNAFYKNPLLGTGYSSLGLATDNDILRSLAETGLLGTISLGLIFFIIIRKITGGMKSEDRYIKFLSIGLLSVCVAVLITSLFIDVLEASKVAELLWILLGLGWVAVSLPSEKASDE